MKRNLLIATAAALIPAGFAFAQTTSPSSQQQPSTDPQSIPSQGNSGNSQTPGNPSSTQGQGQQGSQGSQSNQGSHGNQSSQGSQNQGNQSSSAGTFSSMDSDGDGRISRDEASSNRKLGRGFSQADRNGDGYLSTDEYMSHSSGSGKKTDSNSTSPMTSPQQ